MGYVKRELNINGPSRALFWPPDYEDFWWYSIPFLLLIINRIQE
jgi:hypothetical protein